jgi:hypothetical protein
MSRSFIPITTDPRDSPLDRMSGGPGSMNTGDWPDGVIELSRYSDERYVGCKFFDGYSLRCPDFEALFERAQRYSKDEMNHFAWAVYKYNQWRFTARQEIGPDGMPVIVPTREELEKKQFSDVGLQHDRNCGVDRMLARVVSGTSSGFDDEPWHAGEFPSAWFSTWHMPDPDHENAYLEYTVCKPCTDGIVGWMAPATGPGAWEYR